MFDHKISIVIYSKHVRRVSGVQTFEKNLIHGILSDTNIPAVDITYVYDVADQGALKRFEQIAHHVVQNKRQSIKCDICIYGSVYTQNHNIEASTYIQVHHTNYKDYQVNYIPAKEINYHVAVSESVHNMLKNEFGIDSVVIPNLVYVEAPQKVLRLVTATRLAKGKGLERIKTIAKVFEDNKIPYVWEIYGEGSMMYETFIKQHLKEHSHVVFLGSQSTIGHYMACSDYVVQLSDSEGFCYSIHEALQLKKPVIVTDWDGVRDWVKDGKDGYILDMELKNLDVQKLYKSIPSLQNYDKLDVNNILQSWYKLFS